MNKKSFRLRRTELFKKMGGNSAAIIFAAKEYCEKYPYRQDSDFYYLTGFNEPEAVAVLISGRDAKEFILFNREPDCAKTVWEGECVGQRKACNKFGADQAFAISKIEQVIPGLLKNCKNIYFDKGIDNSNDRKLKRWLLGCKASKNHLLKLNSLNKIVHEMRIKKDHSELQLIRKVSDITSRGILRAMEKCRPGMYEYELTAELLYEFARSEGCSEAFKSIVAAGKNGCTLHYGNNNKKLLKGELVLIDAGAEHNYYCSDISRTFPVNGKFTRNQQTIYELVLAVQQAVIEQIRPGISWGDLQSTADRMITEGLVDIKLLTGDAKELQARQEFKRFFMHRIGHWVGLNVHDVGEYKVDGKWRTLETGMVLTVEPGLYITNKNIGAKNKKWCNVGVRIEDVVLVTAKGSEILTNGVPKSVAEIERVMK